MNETPPHDLDTEESVLASLLIDNDSIPEVIDTIVPGDFYRSTHARIYEAIVRVFKSKRPVDLVTVTDGLRANKHLESVGGAGFIANLIDHVPMATNLPHYVKILKKLAVRRNSLIVANELSKKALDMAVDPDDIVEKAMKQMAKLTTDPDGGPRELKDITFEMVERYEKLWRDKKLITGVPGGFDRLDFMLSGMQPSDLLILAARPSMGKTALAVQIMKGASEVGHRCLMFSLEQPIEQLYDRLVAARASMNISHLRNGQFRKDAWANMNEAFSYLEKLPFTIDDRGALTYKEIRKVSRREARTNGVGLIVVDHLQLVRGAGNKSRNDEIGLYTREFKAMAKELRVPVLVLSQLSRSLENRNDKRPVLSDLRDSGNIEQDADVVMFIYRDEVYNRDPSNPNRGKADLIIAKQRQGPIGVVPLTWLARSTKFLPYFDEEDSHANTTSNPVSGRETERADRSEGHSKQERTETVDGKRKDGLPGKKQSSDGSSMESSPRAGSLFPDDPGPQADDEPF